MIPPGRGRRESFGRRCRKLAEAGAESTIYAHRIDRGRLI
jgi:hypothetical protein